MSCGRLERLFAAQARSTPQAPALLHHGVTTSYAELDTLSDRIAAYLGTRGVGRGTLAGLLLERTPLLVATMLGVLKAGAAYLPLDPHYPVDRLDFMLADSGASHLLTEASLGLGVDFAGAVCALDTDRAAIDAMPAVAPNASGASGADLAYVIYTSGSTGRPKGVMLAHSATGLVAWLRRDLGAADIARVAACTSICFDPSIIEIFGTLCTGGLVVLKRDALEPFTPDERPTMLAAPPSILSELARLGAIPDSVRVLNVGGEAVSASLVRTLYRSTSAQRIYNHYGPTEATTCTTVALTSPDAEADPTIGTPIAGARVYILDEDGEPVPEGGIGELHIAGPTVAIGYINSPDEAAARFLADPFVPGDRMYRTGDLGQVLASGEIAFRGRRDTQVKLHGYRIELGEVEAALMRIDGVREAAALVHPDEDGRVRLHAYVAGDRRIDLPDARRRLATWLPLHMLPTRIVNLDNLPLGPTGKIDRAALVGLADDGAASSAGEAPASMIESIIAETFARHLGRQPIGRDDDFYACGGDSLSAIDVALELEAILGKTITPVELAHDTTPRALAAALAEQPVGDGAVLTPLQAEGDGPILFCTPELYGRPLSYVGLARRLAPTHRMMGLGLGDASRDLAAIPGVRDVSRIYGDAIRAMQPAGPYIVSGYSFGAVPAFDLAQLLRAEGEQVVLILIDGPVLRRPPSLGHVARWLRRETPLALRDRGAVQMARDIWGSRSLWRRILSRDPQTIRALKVPRFVPRADRAVARHLMRAVFAYRPEPFDGPSLLIGSTRPHATLSLASEDGRLGWSGLLRGPVRHRIVPGTHTQIMQAAQLDEVRAAILSAIAEWA